MTARLHMSLVILALLSQILGGATVLCMEGDGSLLLELQLVDCCDGANADDLGSEAIESSDGCGTCSDVPLTVHDRDRGQGDLEVLLADVTSPPLLGFPLEPRVESGSPVRSAIAGDARGTLTATAFLVAATIVLTC